MVGMSQTGQARQAAPMARADLEAAIAALPGRKQRLLETFDRLVACAPLHVQLTFTWDDIDAHVSSLHASFSLRFRQMQQQPLPSVPVRVSGSAIHDDEQPHPGAPVSPTATPDGEQPHPGVPVSPTATPHGEQPNPGVPVSESIKEDEEMISNDEQNIKDEDASLVHEKKEDQVEKDREDKKVSIVVARRRKAGGTRDQVRRINQRQPYMVHQQEFPPTVPMYNSTPMMVQQPLYVPYFRQEFFPDMVRREAPMCIDHVLQQQYMAHYQPYLPQHVHHQPYFPIVTSNSHALGQPHMATPSLMGSHLSLSVTKGHAASAQGSNRKRCRLSRTTNEDIINVLVKKPSKKSKTINKHNAKPKPYKPKHNAKPKPEEPIEKKTIYDYF